MDYCVVILKTSTGDAACEDFARRIKDSDEMRAFVSTSLVTYFIEVMSGKKDFDSGIGKKLKDFYTKDFRQDQGISFGQWSDAVPRLIVYQGCASCSTDPNRPAIIKAQELDPSGKSAAEVVEMLALALS